MARRRRPIQTDEATAATLDPDVSHATDTSLATVVSVTVDGKPVSLDIVKEAPAVLDRHRELSALTRRKAHEMAETRGIFRNLEDEAIELREAQRAALSQPRHLKLIERDQEISSTVSRGRWC